MIKLNIHEVKTHLSKYLAKLKTGDRILLCNRNQPVAEITALPKTPTHPRSVGLAKGQFSVSPVRANHCMPASDGWNVLAACAPLRWDWDLPRTRAMMPARLMAPVFCRMCFK